MKRKKRKKDIQIDILLKCQKKVKKFGDINVQLPHSLAQPRCKNLTTDVTDHRLTNHFKKSVDIYIDKSLNRWVNGSVDRWINGSMDQ